jgi:hypothetical protein
LRDKIEKKKQIKKMIKKTIKRISTIFDIKTKQNQRRRDEIEKKNPKHIKINQKKKDHN